MSKSRFIKNSFIYTVGDMLPKVIAFFMIPLYTKYLDTTNYGIVNVVTTVMGFFSMFYILGLNGSLSRFYYDNKEKEKQQVFISTLWLALFIFDLILTLVLVFFGQGISHLIFKSIPFDPYFKLMVLTCFFTTFTTMPMILFRMREEAFKFGLFNVLTTIVNICFIIYFVVFLRQGAEGNLKGYLYTNIVFTTIFLIFTFKDLKFKFSFEVLKEGLRYGIPLIPHAVGGWVLMVSDRWFLEQYRTLSEVGIYGVAYQLGLLVYYLLGAINKAYVPFFFKTAGEDKNAKAIFEDIIKYYSVLILSLGLGIALFSREVIVIMSSNKAYYAAAGVIPIITLAYVFDGYYYMAINGIFYAKKTHLLAATTGITAVVDIILNWILIPKFGMYGAATATAGAYLVIFILTHRLSQKYYHLRWDWKSIILNGALCLAIYFTGSISIGSFIVNAGYKCLIYIVYVVILFLTGILSFKNVKPYVAKILKSRG